jgi:hypothetical protein
MPPPDLLLADSELPEEDEPEGAVARAGTAARAGSAAGEDSDQRRFS